jgi:hypothetical protein
VPVIGNKDYIFTIWSREVLAAVQVQNLFASYQTALPRAETKKLGLNSNKQRIIEGAPLPYLYK